MQLPNLIIVGVFKAGTTSLFRYLSMHPDICGSKKKEIHYFTPLVYETGEKLRDLKHYSSFFSCNREKYRLEASPAYFYGGEKVISEMQKVLPANHKVILLLRKPSDRFVSYYKHIKSQFLIDDNFPLFVEKCIQEYSKSTEFRIGHYKNAIREGLYVNLLPVWKEYYGSNLRVIFFDDLKNNPLGLMHDISDWLKIEGDFFNNEEFAVENMTINPKSSMLHKLALSVYNKWEHFFRSSKTKTLFRNFYRKINNSTLENISIDSESLNKIKEIYKPYNSRLNDYLGQIPNSWL